MIEMISCLPLTQLLTNGPAFGIANQNELSSLRMSNPACIKFLWDLVRISSKKKKEKKLLLT
jgi:hypothetical protein